MRNQVFRDPSVKDSEAWRVLYNGEVLTPVFNSKGAAQVYLNQVECGLRKPERKIK